MEHQISQQIEQFADYLIHEKNHNPLTVRNYKSYLLRLTTATKITQLRDITVDVVSRFKSSLLASGVSHKTINYYLIGLRVFLKYCKAQDLDCLAPEKVEMFRNVKAKKIELISKEELTLFITYKLNPTSDLLVNLLFSTGMRIFELAKVNIEDMRSCSFSVRGKGGKDRVVFLTGKTCAMLHEYLGERKTGPIFLNKNGQRMSIRYLQEIVAERSDKLSMSKPVSCHTLRHLFATDLLENGADIRSVQEMLGHASITTTQIYTHLSNEHLAKSHSKFHSEFK